MKIDLHVHTSEDSRCGKVPGEEMVRLYKEAGYDAICITNHFTSGTADSFKKYGQFDFIKVFDTGFEIARKEGERIGLRVFKGYELRCDKNTNDYLIYDLPKFVIDNVREIMTLDNKEFLTVLRQNGVKIFQAHPFRNNITVTDPSLIDGIEVFNGSHKGDYRDTMAKTWANAHPHLIQVSGSDAHRDTSVGRGGIITDRDVKNNDDLLDTLVSRDFTLVRNYDR
jgi:predicted metal-dependent phosphoesterase TrpH